MQILTLSLLSMPWRSCGARIVNESKNVELRNALALWGIAAKEKGKTNEKNEKVHFYV